MARHVAVDSVAITKLRRGDSTTGAHRVTEAIKQRALRIVLDPKRALLSEWERSAGFDFVHVLMTAWSDLQGVHILPRLSTIPRDRAHVLRTHGFNGTIDKLVLRIAITIAAGTIVSDDSDFYDPSDKRSVGNLGAPVATVVQSLGVTLLTLFGFMRTLPELPSGPTRRKPTRRRSRR